MSEQRIRVLTNIRRLHESILPDGPLSFSYAGSDSRASEFITKCLRSDLVILDADVKNLLLACAIKWVLPLLRFKIVSVDLILRTPRSPAAHVKAFFKRLLLIQVDRFVLFFRNLNGCERFYGIGPDRAVYVPFKVNGCELITARPRGTADGDYVLCAGRTLRDIETFVEAMKHAGCRGVLLQQRRELLDAHGTSAWSGELPRNVKLIVDDSDQLEPYLDFIEKARLVVIPRFRGDIAPTGISTYLVAMALNKCVIISAGPGAEDVLTDQAVIVPPEDPKKLAEQIKRLWDGDELRTAIAARGYEYAMSLGGHERLLSDILRISLDGLALPAGIILPRGSRENYDAYS